MFLFRTPERVGRIMVILFDRSLFPCLSGN